MKYLETIKPTHRPPVDLADRVRHNSLNETPRSHQLVEHLEEWGRGSLSTVFGQLCCQLLT
jgi:hypothetical protein